MTEDLNNFVDAMSKALSYLSHAFEDSAFSFAVAFNALQKTIGKLTRSHSTIARLSDNQNCFIRTDKKLFSPVHNAANDYGPVSYLGKYKHIRYRKIHKCLCGSNEAPYFITQAGYPALVCNKCAHMVYYQDSQGNDKDWHKDYNDIIKKLEIRIWNNSVSQVPMEVPVAF